jgi:hypothetical protein
MPVKIARSTPRPSFGLPELLIAIHTSRQSCCKVGKARIFTPVRGHPGNPGLNHLHRNLGGIADRRWAVAVIPVGSQERRSARSRKSERAGVGDHHDMIYCCLGLVDRPVTI